MKMAGSFPFNLGSIVAMDHGYNDYALAPMLRMKLFTYRSLTDWLDNPFGTSALSPGSLQISLGLV